MTERKVRVRFAPSPTGPLHIGGVRTALYNYLFARQHGGDMIFRIEDTDSNRFVPGAEEYILESFRWLGIQFDEGVSFGGIYGPYRQSERRDIYKKYVQVLLDEGHAYIAFDTPEELAKKRDEIPNFQYDASTRMQMRNSLTMPKEEVLQLMAEGTQYVVRFKIEAGEEVHVDDLIRGHVVVNSSILDDKVLYKSADELPTYHLANIVDDHLMEVSHVIRGEEWLPSAPLHVLLYRAFGWEDTMPQFAHLPLLLKPEGNGKLSKRDGDRLGFPVFPLEWHDPKSGEISSGYREKGYLPEAVINFLALLGWNPGDEREIFSLQELAQCFSSERLNKSPAIFDITKLTWMNGCYIRNLSAEEFHKLAEPYYANIKTAINLPALSAVLQPRVETLNQIISETDFLSAVPDYALSLYENKKMKTDTEVAKKALHLVLPVLQSVTEWTNENLFETLKGIAADNEMKNGQILYPVRIALSGKETTPGGATELAYILGKEETLRRIESAITKLG